MKLESMKEEFLSHAKNIFLFDCQVAGLDAQVLSVLSMRRCLCSRATQMT